MFCAHCGKDLGETQFCNQCGWSVDAIDMPMGSPPQTGNGYAIASLVCGVVSFSTCGGWLLVPIIGLILGGLGMKSEQPGIAIAGIVLNAVILVLIVMFVVFVIGASVLTSSPPSSGRCC